jgi:hypothetical protein
MIGKRILKWAVKQSGGKASFPATFDSPAAPSIPVTVADRLDALCLKYSAKYERHPNSENLVTLCLAFPGGDRICESAPTTKEAFEALVRRLEV